MRLRVIACIAIGSWLCLTFAQFNAVAITDSTVYKQAQQSQTNFLAPLKTLVNIDSGTGDLQGLTKVENLVIDRLKSIGADVKTIDAKPSAGRNIIATVKGTGKGKILLLAHTDTVFKQGGALANPFRIANGKAYGLGIMDDKGSALGLVGGSAHTKDEYIEIDRIAPRIYLLTKLLMDLGNRE